MNASNTNRRISNKSICTETDVDPIAPATMTITGKPILKSKKDRAKENRKRKGTCTIARLHYANKKYYF